MWVEVIEVKGLSALSNAKQKEKYNVKAMTKLLVYISLLVMASAWTTLAQSAANEVTNQQLESRGISIIGGPSAPRSMPGSMIFQARNHPDPDANEPVGTGSKLATPKPIPLAVTTPGPKAFGFNGINGVDSALVNEGFVVEPPDQGLCVGNGFVMEGVNEAVAVYDGSSGALLGGPTQINAFFKLDFAQFTSDPRCFFDTQTRHWFVTLLQIDIDPTTGAVTNHSHGLIAVSATDSPLSAFSIFAIDTTDDGTNGTQSHAGCPCFGDQPLLGADVNGFFYSANEFSITALTGGGPVFSNGAQIYAMSKRQLAAGLGPTVVHFGQIPLTKGHFGRSIQPAQSVFSGEGDIDPSEHGVEYFVSHLNFNHTFDNRIAVWAISDTRSLNQQNPTVELTSTVIKSEVYGDPPSATQKAGPNPFGASLTPPQPEGDIDSGDTRMQQVFFANGLLWTSLTTAIQQQSNVLAGGAFFIISPSLDHDRVNAQIQQQGYISVAGDNVVYPAIAVNQNGKGVVTFTVSGPDFFPSAAYARINADRGAGKIHIIAAGAFADDGFTVYPPFSNGVGRWGDYSAAAVDESGNLWFATEYIPPTLSGFPQGLGVNWGTFIGTINAGENDDN
jgi:hypothetical protein